MIPDHSKTERGLKFLRERQCSNVRKDTVSILVVNSLEVQNDTKKVAAAT